jgi:hypothetical protein
VSAPLKDSVVVFLVMSGDNLENFYKFENILPGMRRKVNISTLMVFRNQRRRSV